MTMTKRLSAVMPFLFLSCLVCAQSFESWIDGDYSHRTSGTATSEELMLSHDVSSLPPGIHYFNFRAQTDDGVWGSVTRHLFIVPGMAAEAAKEYECWIDGDYDGKVVRQITNATEIANILDVSQLPPGLHYYNMRCRDAHGVWSSVNRYLFVVTEAVHPAYIEYWIDGDTQASVRQPVAGDSIVLSINTSRYGDGTHTFSCKLQGSNGQWTEEYAYPFVLETQQDTLTHEPQKGEYFFDHDPGYGKARPLPAVGTDTLRLALSTEGLSVGAHVLYVRSADDSGKWSATVSHPLYIRGASDDRFLALEYFYDTDPGIGMATALPLGDYSLEEALRYTLSTQTLDAGLHSIAVRGQRRGGSWSEALSRQFLVVRSEPGMEYFFDRDPGYGKGLQTSVTDGRNTVAIDLGELEAGAHVLYVRCHDGKGRWSATVSHPLYVCKAVDIVQLEYFFDTADPGIGKATQVALPADKYSRFTFEIALGNLQSGQHTLNVRAKGSGGLWTLLSSESFELTDESGIDGIHAAGQQPKVIFTLGGLKVGRQLKGVNIIRFEDGSTNKVINK